jgi:hypothetical protein
MNARLWIGIGLFTTTLLAGTARAETFYLANGDVLEGKVISERTDRWVVDVGRGEIEVLKADIARIVPAPRRRRSAEPDAKQVAKTVEASAPTVEQLPELLKLAADPRDEVAIAALRSIGRMGGQAFAERGSIEKIARDPARDATVRVVALEALVPVAAGKSLLCLAELLGDKEPLVQAASRDLFVDTARAPLSKDIRSFLEKHATTGSHRVRLNALRCLAIGDPECDAILERRSREDEHEDLRTAAVQALGREAPPEVPQTNNSGTAPAPKAAAPAPKH